MPNDTLYHLGDFAFRGASPALYRSQIKCKNIVLVTGNHDPHNKDGSAKKELYDIFSRIYDLTKIKVNINNQSQHIILCHYAMRVWRNSHHGSWCLYGHSHYSLPDNVRALSIDVGVDAVAGRLTGLSYKKLMTNSGVVQRAWSYICGPSLRLDPRDYMPMSLADIAKLMSKKKFKPIDHHF